MFILFVEIQHHRQRIDQQLIFSVFQCFPIRRKAAFVKIARQSLKEICPIKSIVNFRTFQIKVETLPRHIAATVGGKTLYLF
ncbi:hypothetical protein DSW25_00440 [Sulfitobacter donghicola DSW-25 = KCTC 12864 = JCM 14565]|uniref:Uncharacterized protein n=1 Tax=Sulfitobacter donghicola DSW-25 = KCTC 12864 = JCM 14565 TaxID=1300350 RepID=A0A073IYG9_9RHOB|nr:hypothetical protein DSW25_00440 [Sulfitobacter donghicola DSW-25 = KCTC 12864 = JCM 14565]